METPATQLRIRLSLPFWGMEYAQRVTDLTLPALLAPENLPCLAKEFKVEIALVTEKKLFDFVTKSPVYRRLEEFADVKLLSLDDLLTGVAGDYGPVLTFALLRGFEDLGERMLDYYLLFLSADFILANGSYRTLARLIKEGHQVIHCPSFRGTYEEVVPDLLERLDADRSVLSISPREMVALAFRNKHLTVTARTVNQRLTHQWRMDQFYWYVNKDTLIGYQWPIALVGLRPQAVVTTPKLMFDYGFIPEICPTAEKYYIRDSDEFFMLEPQRRSAGKDMVRVGWITEDAIAEDLSLWTTKEQRECGQQMHVFHSADLPPDMTSVADESRKYISTIVEKLGPPNPHDEHPLFKTWWEGVTTRIDRRRMAIAEGLKPQDARRRRSWLGELYWGILRWVYERAFGGLPHVYPTHPLWLETRLLSRAFREEKAKGAKILWISEANSTLACVARLADVWISRGDLLMQTRIAAGPLAGKKFDACMFDITIRECDVFPRLYRIARQFLSNGGRIYLNLTVIGWRTVEKDDAEFCELVFPDLDESKAIFSSGKVVRVVRDFFRNYIRWVLPQAVRPFVIGAFLFALAPITYFSNLRAARSASGVFQKGWMNLFAEFKVLK